MALNDGRALDPAAPARRALFPRGVPPGLAVGIPRRRGVERLRANTVVVLRGHALAAVGRPARINKLPRPSPTVGGCPVAGAIAERRATYAGVQGCGS